MPSPLAGWADADYSTLEAASGDEFGKGSADVDGREHADDLFTLHDDGGAELLSGHGRHHFVDWCLGAYRIQLFGHRAVHRDLGRVDDVERLHEGDIAFGDDAQ